jgi:hypothetical protein
VSDLSQREGKMKITHVLSLILLAIAIVVVLREAFRTQDVILTWQAPPRKPEAPDEYAVEIRHGDRR